MKIFKRFLLYIDDQKNPDCYKNNTENKTLCDFLALDRTILANERTFLAWLRTSVSMIALGIGVIKFNLSDTFISSAGTVLLILGIIIGFIGSFRYYRIHKKLQNI